MATVVQLQKVAPLGNIGKGLQSFAKDFAKGRKEDRISGDLSEAMENFTTASSESTTQEQLADAFSEVTAAVTSIPGIDPTIAQNTLSSANALYGAAVSELSRAGDIEFLKAVAKADETGDPIDSAVFSGASPELVAEKLEERLKAATDEVTAQAARVTAEAAADRAETAAADAASARKLREAQAKREEALHPAAMREAEAAAAVKEAEEGVIKDAVTHRGLQLNILKQQAENEAARLVGQAAEHASKMVVLRIQEITALNDSDAKLLDKYSAAYEKRHPGITKSQAVAENAIVLEANNTLLKFFSKTMAGGSITLDPTPGKKQKWLYATQLTEQLLRKAVIAGEEMPNPRALASLAHRKALADFNSGRILGDTVVNNFIRAVKTLPEGTLVFDVKGIFLDDADDADKRHAIFQPLRKVLQTQYGFDGDRESDEQIRLIMEFMYANKFETGKVDVERFIKAYTDTSVATSK